MAAIHTSSVLEALTWTVVSLLAIAGVVLLGVRAVRWAKRGTKGGAVLAALAYPNPDLPPPQQQVEEATRRKKDPGSGAPPD